MQGFACGALSNMALKNGAVAEAIGESGAIDHIVDVMRRHLASSGVQHGGCGALASLSIVEKNVELIEQADGLSQILAGMDAHLDVCAVQQTALYAVRQQQDKYVFNIVFKINCFKASF